MIWAAVLRENLIIIMAAIILVAVPLVSQTGPGQKLSFEVATIKPTAPDFRGRFATMQGPHQFVVAWILHQSRISLRLFSSSSV